MWIFHSGVPSVDFVCHRDSELLTHELQVLLYLNLLDVDFPELGWLLLSLADIRWHHVTQNEDLASSLAHHFLCLDTLSVLGIVVIQVCQDSQLIRG